MRKESRRLLKALRASGNVTPDRVRMASIILSCNGIEAALDYVIGACVSVEAAEIEWHENLQNDWAL